jgi:hypothetical protein
VTCPERQDRGARNAGGIFHRSDGGAFGGRETPCFIAGVVAAGVKSSKRRRRNETFRMGGNQIGRRKSSCADPPDSRLRSTRLACCSANTVSAGRAPCVREGALGANFSQPPRISKPSWTAARAVHGSFLTSCHRGAGTRLARRLARAEGVTSP